MLKRASLAALALTACTVTGAGGFRIIGPAQPAVAVQAEVRIDFFGIPLNDARDVVFVLDRSGSMGEVSAGFAGKAVGMSRGQAALAGFAASLVNSAAHGPLPSKMEVAKAELVRTLRALPDGTRVGVVFFDDELAAVAPTLIVLTPDSRAAIEGFVRGITARGSTAAAPALDLAYRMGAARVVLLSDGLANTGGSASELLARARGEIQRGLRFDTVGVGIDQDSSLLQSLAAESGGMAVMR
ncbi:MAG: VWA domain-containing protein [Deltaproteobacteria bacterium]|nr:VWA domain-containing protein [Deltaproteobacteria bacterium]